MILGCDLFTIKKLNFSNKLKIFAAASQSILRYGAEIWGFKTYEQVNKLLRYFLKKMLYLPKNKKVLNLQNNRLPKILAEVSI